MKNPKNLVEKIISAAVLFSLSFGRVPNARDLATFCDYPGHGAAGGDPAGSVLTKLKAGGDYEASARGSRLTEKGKKRLEEFTAEVRALERAQGSDLVAMAEGVMPLEPAFALFDRFRSVLFFINKTFEKDPEHGFWALAVLTINMADLLAQKSPYLSARANDLVDFVFTQLTRTHFLRLQPNGPKTPDPKEIRWIKIAKGLFHGRMYSMTRTGPVIINLLRINPKFYTLSTHDCSTLPDNKRTLEEVCKANGAICGTTGGFFLYPEPGIEPHSKRGDPIGLVITNTEVICPPVFTRSALMVDRENKVFISRVGMKGLGIEIREARFSAKKINAHPNRGEIAVFTPVFGAKTLGSAGFYVTVVGRTVVEVATEPPEIPINGFVVVVNQPPTGLGVFGEISVGDSVKYTMPRIKGMGEIVSAMAGGPLLVGLSKDVFDYEGEQMTGFCPPVTFSKSSTVGRALVPRMAWGITAQFELIAMAVDGRNLLRSVGMPLDDMAKYMKQLGCVSALNFDGGASKQMVVSGKQVDESPVEMVVEAGRKDRSRRLCSTAILIK